MSVKYKIIKDNKVIDVVAYADFVRFLPSGIVVRTAKELAEGIVGSDQRTIYRFAVAGFNGDAVEIEEITIEEFNRLQSLLNSNQEVYANNTVLASAKRSVITSLSATCKRQITLGFRIKLSDGAFYCFSLSAEDQLNLLNLENQLASGEQTFIYHADGQPSRIFNKEDMSKVITAFRKHVLYHTTYFNAAKQYINSLTDLEKINLFSYGDDVSESVAEGIVKQILRTGGSL